MQHKLILIMFFLHILPLHCAMAPLRQLAIIKPFFAKAQTIHTIRNTINLIERKKLTYPDYDNRSGIIWSDFLVNLKRPERITECKNTVKFTLVNNELQQQNPESVFKHAQLKNILCQEILPKTFAYIRTNNWAILPETIFAQFFLQRCCVGEAMSWHQDPGENYDTMADFSLVIMLSEQNHPTHGWDGGEFKIREGLPNNTYHENEVKTIIPQYNQAFLFNNKTYSHRINAITCKNNQAQRDIIVVPLYLEKMPQLAIVPN
jgi:hypothetical protein